MKFKFGPTLKDLITTFYSINDEENAKEFYKQYVEYLKLNMVNHHYSPEKVAGVNIGFCLGERPVTELFDERSQMWHKICPTINHWFPV